jgi:hypothetical protein
MPNARRQPVIRRFGGSKTLEQSRWFLEGGQSWPQELPALQKNKLTHYLAGRSQPHRSSPDAWRWNNLRLTRNLLTRWLPGMKGLSFCAPTGPESVFFRRKCNLGHMSGIKSDTHIVIQ